MRYYKCEDGTLVLLEGIIAGEPCHGESLVTNQSSSRWFIIMKEGTQLSVPEADYDKISDILMGVSNCGWESLGVCQGDMGSVESRHPKDLSEELKADAYSRFRLDNG